MKKTFRTPIIAVSRFNKEDVITTSGGLLVAVAGYWTRAISSIASDSGSGSGSGSGLFESGHDDIF